MKKALKVLVAVVLTLWMGIGIVYVIGEPDYVCTAATVIAMKAGGLGSCIICGIIIHALIHNGYFDVDGIIED